MRAYTPITEVFNMAKERGHAQVHIKAVGPLGKELWAEGFNSKQPVGDLISKVSKDPKIQKLEITLSGGAPTVKIIKPLQ
jgi:hypothetical protein